MKSTKASVGLKWGENSLWHSSRFIRASQQVFLWNFHSPHISGTEGIGHVGHQVHILSHTAHILNHIFLPTFLGLTI